MKEIFKDARIVICIVTLVVCGVGYNKTGSESWLIAVIVVIGLHLACEIFLFFRTRIGGIIKNLKK